MAKSKTRLCLDIGDYLADTMHLQAREHGAYLLLMMHYAHNGPLPDDDDTLAAIARTDLRTWVTTTGPIVRAFFDVHGGCMLRCIRLDDARASVDLLAATKRKAADIMWAKRRATKSTHNQLFDDPQSFVVNGQSTEAHAYAQPMHIACTSHAASRVDSLTQSTEVQEKEVSKSYAPQQAAMPIITKSARGHRIPEDWQPTVSDAAFAVSRHLDPQETAAHFRDYWMAAAGRTATKMNWSLAFKVWCRSTKQANGSQKAARMSNTDKIRERWGFNRPSEQEPPIYTPNINGLLTGN